MKFLWDAMKHDAIPEANQHRCNLGQRDVVEKRQSTAKGCAFVAIRPLHQRLSETEELGRAKPQAA